MKPAPNRRDEDASDRQAAAAVAKSKYGARPATFGDTLGSRGDRLFAVSIGGHRLSGRAFYGLRGKGHFRDGYLLVTTAKAYEPPSATLFGDR